MNTVVTPDMWNDDEVVAMGIELGLPALCSNCEAGDVPAPTTCPACGLDGCARCGSPCCIELRAVKKSITLAGQRLKKYSLRGTTMSTDVVRTYDGRATDVARPSGDGGGE